MQIKETYLWEYDYTYAQCVFLCNTHKQSQLVIHFVLKSFPKWANQPAGWLLNMYEGWLKGFEPNMESIKI